MIFKSDFKLNHFKEIIKEAKTTGNYDIIDDGMPLIQIAAIVGDLELVKQLKTPENVNIESQNKYTFRNTPLIEAARNGHVDLVEYLISNGANIEHKNFMGNTALMKAVNNRHLKIVELLLEKGANIECTDNVNATPLLIASGKGYFEIVKLLVSKGANVNHIDHDGDSALSLASKCRDFRIVKFLKTHIS